MPLKKMKIFPWINMKCVGYSYDTDMSWIEFSFAVHFKLMVSFATTLSVHFGYPFFIYQPAAILEQETEILKKDTFICRAWYV